MEFIIEDKTADRYFFEYGLSDRHKTITVVLRIFAALLNILMPPILGNTKPMFSSS